MPGVIARACSLPFVLVIWIYRFTLSPIIGGQCRYDPTCSQYGLDAYRLHGPIRGTAMTIGRILRCHPLAKGGYDPVPIPESKSEEIHDLP
jgi:putative membrane protein insertion efficiency factor